MVAFVAALLTTAPLFFSARARIVFIVVGGSSFSRARIN
jgi:hypothetical protein